MNIINKDSEDKDCSKYIHLMHHVTLNGVIIWPESRAGQVSMKEGE